METGRSVRRVAPPGCRTVVLPEVAAQQPELLLGPPERGISTPMTYHVPQFLLYKSMPSRLGQWSETDV